MLRRATSLFGRRLYSAMPQTFNEEKLALESIRSKLSSDELSRLDRLRNIGVAAHIDSGKTTFTERVLFYTGRIKAIHEVRGRDNVGAKMDSMVLEREKGITIQSAATFCDWSKKDQVTKEQQNYHFNLIDTPGHIDFTIEVERALRVLDGAVLVVCAVSGVQSQTVTVDRQMRRYNVPRVTFINKMDRMGANPWRAIDQIRQKLHIAAAAVQVPIGSEDKLAGVVDIIWQKALYNRGDNGEDIEEGPIPDDLKELVAEKRQELIEILADVDEEMATIFIDEQEPTPQDIVGAIRRSTIARQFTPVLMGSALANRGVQPVLDAVCDFLPDPSQVLNTGLDVSNPAEETPIILQSSSSEPFLGLAFKLEEGRYGQLTYIRVYQGKMKKGMQMVNVRTGKKIKLARLVRMHSNEMEDVDEAGAGEICATFGIDCSSGDSFTSGEKLAMSSMFVPEPVISLSITPKTRDSQNFSKAINRFQKEDPTFRVRYDDESKETVISGMGELHLEIYVERIRREYNVECSTGKPQVAYRETITSPNTSFEFTHKKQSGGAGQYAKVMGELTTATKPENNEFETAIVGGKIPEKFLTACAKGFEEALAKGPLTGHRVLGVHMLINDGQVHVVDSSELAFRTATIGAFNDAFKRANPILMEPVMTVAVTAPTEFQSAIIGLLNKKEALINDTDVGTEEFTIYADCSLNNMFGFATTLRASTQGKGEFSLEFSHYAPAPVPLQRELISAHEKKMGKK